jgi:hypothetical protein
MPDLIRHPWIPVFTGMTTWGFRHNAVMPDHKPVMPDLIGHPWLLVCTAMTAESFQRYP